LLDWITSIKLIKNYIHSFAFDSLTVLSKNYNRNKFVKSVQTKVRSPGCGDRAVVGGQDVHLLEPDLVRRHEPTSEANTIKQITKIHIFATNYRQPNAKNITILTRYCNFKIFKISILQFRNAFKYFGTDPSMASHPQVNIHGFSATTFDQFTSILTNLHQFWSIYINLYQFISILTNLPTSILTILPTSILTNLPTSIMTNLPTLILTNLHQLWPIYLHQFWPIYINFDQFTYINFDQFTSISTHF
jgi:hypothetical protein